MSTSLLTEFIVKRAFRIGKVTAGDIQRASDVSSATATRIAQQTLFSYGGVIQRQGRALVPKPFVEPPVFATEADLLKTLDKGWNMPIYTGIFTHELPVSYVSWSNTLPPAQGVFTTITKSICQQTLLDITYLSIQFNAEPKKISIFPLALEKMNDQWRLVAQDIGKTGYPIRVFVLSRILDAVLGRQRKPKGMIRQHHHDAHKKIPIVLNPELTELQQVVLSRELNIADGHVDIVSRSEFEFFRRFAETPKSENAVWPVLRKKE